MEVSKCWKIGELSKILSRFWEIIQPLPHHFSKPDKILLFFIWRYTEIYRHFFSKVLQDCSFRAWRNDAVQMYFLTPKRKMLAGKFVKWKRFFMSSELRFIKWMRFFEQNCLVKSVNFSAIFCWVWDFLLEN